MSKIVLEVNELSKEYSFNKKKTLVLNNINMSISQGEIYGIIGENGAGKSTLMKIITGRCFQTAGSLKLFQCENSCSEYRKQLERVGVLIENGNMYSKMSVIENLHMVGFLDGQQNCRNYDEILELVGLQEQKYKQVKNLSTGMRRRLGLAIALLGDKKFLVLDEPLNGLDPDGIIDFREIIKKVNREQGSTILISSHILSELSQVCTCYGFICKGNMVKQINSKENSESLESLYVSLVKRRR